MPMYGSCETHTDARGKVDCIEKRVERRKKVRLT